MVEQIEKLAAEREGLPLMGPESFHDGHVHIDEIRTNQRIASEIAVRTSSGQFERCRVVPAFDLADDRIVRRPGTKARPLGRIRVSVVRWVEAKLGAEWRARVSRRDHTC